MACFIAAIGSSVARAAKRVSGSGVIKLTFSVAAVAAAALLLLKMWRPIGYPGYDVPYSRVERKIDAVLDRILRG